ncbi:GNAT family N-acetyltransferase [Acerihabitans sp. KWT182]|uniref:GNAT family N-acetyltransferase n=1 Tax=Acerihabitans sp. KWT182 TaxID=3157919 RepID=A0AAU7QEE5_9GAMM
MLHLRAARLDELEQLTELCLLSKALSGYDDAFMRDCRQMLRFRPADIEKTSICVAEADNTLLGAAQLYFEDEIAFLQRLFVSPDKTKNGIGKALFGWSLKAAHRAGAKRLLIDCDPAIAGFFQRMGAREEGIVDSGTVPGYRIPRFKVTLSPCRSPSEK